MKRLFWLSAIVGVLLVPLLVRAADAPPLKKVLFFTASQGFQHGPVQRRNGEVASGEKWLTEVGAKHGFAVTCTKYGELVTDQGLAQYDAVVLYTTGDLTAPNGLRDGSTPMPKNGREVLQRFVAGGKGLVGIHSATDTFHSGKTGDPFIRLIGAEFAGHGAMQKATQKVIETGFPGLEGLEPTFVQFDEWYTFKSFAKDIDVVLLQSTEGMKGPMYEGKPAFPSTWARQEGQGRVFYTSMGHDQKGMNTPVFEKVFMAGLKWAAGVTQYTPKPNIAEVAPGLPMAPDN